MNDRLRVTVLGCGGSGGVPLIGNDWGRADPRNPKNRRLRSSILLQRQGTTLLFDTSPDLREQLLSAQLRHLDAVVYTHEHADHVHGIDDLRAMNWLMRCPINIYADDRTLGVLTTRFSYCFAPAPAGQFIRPVLLGHKIDGPFDIQGLQLLPIQQNHGFSESLGFRIGRFAYSTDVVRLDETAFAALAGIDTWIVDCVRHEPHPVHAHLELTLSWIQRLRPRRAYLTHMNHTMDYAELMASLPDGVEPAWDGLVIEISP